MPLNCAYGIGVALIPQIAHVCNRDKKTISNKVALT